MAGTTKAALVNEVKKKWFEGIVFKAATNSFVSSNPGGNNNSNLTLATKAPRHEATGTTKTVLVNEVEKKCGFKI